ncbi:acyl-CoA reductase [Bowmanella denitrificans]|uniref:acyl-CoA reductase n=1 Tax=Bowmanella denitrificans TaxID=366582 RepID=UPI000C999D84|nr:acyl-CoA reductase [Bowmanella denitrificans]
MTPFPDLAEHKDIKWHIKAPHAPASIKPWSDQLILEVDSLARFLLQHKISKEYPEIVALGFWARKANLLKMLPGQARFKEAKKTPAVFHVGPANVDTVFFYSFLLSVLAGNQNIVRVSNRSGALVYQLIDLLQGFFYQYANSEFEQLISIIEYPATSTGVTVTLSEWANMRVIWGGDNSIDAINHIAPHANQLTFPDRYSIALMQIEDAEQIPQAVEAMVKDLLPFRQQACSSPKAIVWWNTSEQLQNAFFLQLNQVLANKENGFDMRDQVEQFVDCQRMVITHKPAVKTIEHNHITCLDLDKLLPDYFDIHTGHGLLLNIRVDTLDSLPYADKLQTIAVFNIPDAMQNELMTNHYVKRVTSLGKALSFQHIWDGVDLCEAFGQLTC